ncbi:type 1 glutamine amidotransferase [Cryobacterium zhongshanensis]|uniref:Lipid II isoglutaminyl synthase (glutamine-hydrolyzing) subunit GatD n=1 Tax=Cryobacterium zhongshanensis TaxID=2928153 RepID=A0AA41UKA2_9MICO|nr:glutamine amidotransferase [Cryobacterium zhongshanensis]MCI4657756.1 glutamine amidotransferase [Cryobacterium zhongshanensis]
MRALTILSVLPELLDTNGDAANARVLAQRARWAGFEATIVPVSSLDDLPSRVDAIVIGSGNDSDLVAARDLLAPLVNALRGWTTAGVPVLAVGTGWELLSWGVELADGSVVDGLGLVAGRAVPLAERATDDLVVESGFGRLVGFENHARGYVGAEASTLGRVLTGVGNGAKTEGLRMGSFLGTHLHGPVLARNPGLADHILSAAVTRAGGVYVRSERAAAVDAIADAATAVVVSSLSLAADA